jgi:hypothetical protein
MLDPKTLTTIAKRVQQKFPEVAGNKPTVQVQNPPLPKSAASTTEGSEPLYLVTFRGTVNSPTGSSIPRLVRVVVNADGKILKITTSR